jgi:hypothetical protein
MIPMRWPGSVIGVGTLMDPNVEETFGTSLFPVA